MSFILNGKVAIITGANQGLGLEISRKYVNAGASIVMCARNGDLLMRAQKELTSGLAPGQVIEVIPADVSDVQSVQQLVKATLQRFGLRPDGSNRRDRLGSVDKGHRDQPVWLDIDVPSCVAYHEGTAEGQDHSAFRRRGNEPDAKH